eukprot:gene47299-61331_t
MNISVYAVRSGSDGDVKLSAIASEVLSTVPLASNPLAADLMAVFSADDVPALGLSLFVLAVNEASSPSSWSSSWASGVLPAEAVELQAEGEGEGDSSEELFSISNDQVAVSFSRRTGRMVSISRSADALSASDGPGPRSSSSFRQSK